MIRSTFAMTLTFSTFAPLGCLSVLDLETDGVETELQCELVACCVDRHDNKARPVRNPEPGDIVFSEVMANPGVADDEDGEWVEFHIRPDLVGSFDLNNLEFGRLGQTQHVTLSPALSDVPIEDMVECLEFFGKDEYVVLGRPGGWETVGLESEIVEVFDFALPNDTPETVLYLRSDTTGLDIQSTYLVSPGAAWSRDESADEWCFSTTTYTGDGLPGENDFGTPGFSNSSCDDQCESSDGVVRDIRRPEVGQLVITEFRADPPGDDRDGVEWLEIYNGGDTDVDLDGLRLYGPDSETFEAFISNTCLEVAAGGHVIVASKPVLGGLTPIYVLDPETNIVNETGALRIHGSEMDSEPLVCVQWGEVDDEHGYASTLDPMFYQSQDGPLCIMANDVEAQWCYTEGSPGAMNEPCPD
jgi:hypothetical protein